MEAKKLAPRRRIYMVVMRSLMWLCAGLTCALVLFLIGFVFIKFMFSQDLPKQFSEDHYVL